MLQKSTSVASRASGSAPEQLLGASQGRSLSGLPNFPPFPPLSLLRGRTWRIANQGGRIPTSPHFPISKLSAGGYCVSRSPLAINPANRGLHAPKSCFSKAPPSSPRLPNIKKWIGKTQKNRRLLHLLSVRWRGRGGGGGTEGTMKQRATRPLPQGPMPGLSKSFPASGSRASPCCPFLSTCSPPECWPPISPRRCQRPEGLA